MSYMPMMEISSILSEGSHDAAQQDQARRYGKSHRSSQQQQHHSLQPHPYQQQNAIDQSHYSSGGNHHSARMRLHQTAEPAPSSRGQATRDAGAHLDPAPELKRSAGRSRSGAKRSHGEHLQVETPPMPLPTAEISRENIVESNRRNHFSFSSDALPLSETAIHYPINAASYVDRTPQQQMRHCEPNGRSAYPTPNPNSPTTSRDARNSIGSNNYMKDRVWATPAPSEEEEAAMTLVFLQTSDRVDRASPREQWGFAQAPTPTHQMLPQRNIEGDIDSDGTEAAYRQQMPYTPASVHEHVSRTGYTHIKRESGDFDTGYFATKATARNPYHTPNDQDYSDRLDEDAQMSEDIKDEDYRDETYGAPKRPSESLPKKRNSISSKKQKTSSSNKSSLTSTRRPSKVIPAPLNLNTTTSLKRSAEDDLSPPLAKRKTINSASSNFIEPVTPTSTVSPTSSHSHSHPHTHAKATLGKSKTLNADEEIGRRCMRCRKSKKGCDRQRPCQRCKDAGIPKEQCISEDESARKKKGAQTKGVRKSGQVALAPAAVSSGQSIAAAQGQMSPILPEAQFVVPARPKKRRGGSK